MSSKGNWIVSTLLHILGVVVCFGGAVLVSLKFPEHRIEAMGLALAALTGLEKALRAHPAVPIADYVNKAEE